MGKVNILLYNNNKTQCGFCSCIFVHLFILVFCYFILKLMVSGVNGRTGESAVKLAVKGFKRGSGGATVPDQNMAVANARAVKQIDVHAR